MTNGRLILADDRIPFTPAPYGLLDTATELPELDRHWQQGLTWEPLCAEGFTTYSRCLVVVRGPSDAEEEPAERDEETPPEPELKEASTFNAIRGATPFAAVAEIGCSPAAGPERIRARAAEALIRSEGKQVEATFWTGIAGGSEVVWPHLAADAPLTEPGAGGAELQPEAEVLSATAVPVVEALGLLEGALGDCYDGVGTIHAPRLLVPHLAEHALVETRGGLMNTTVGTKVAAGRGYPGTGPDGTTADGVMWMYATGEVFYRRGEVFQPDAVQSLDRSRNTVRAMAERPYVLGWDCCLLAVPVQIEQEVT